MNMHTTFWTLIGFFAQALFSARFLVQWITSERRRKSIIPTSFWYLSLTGGLLLAAYAIWRRDPVFIAGQSLGVAVYSRNLFLLRRSRTRELAQGTEAA